MVAILRSMEKTCGRPQIPGKNWVVNFYLPLLLWHGHAGNESKRLATHWVLNSSAVRGNR
jgi:hypothetical protein